MSSAPPIAMKFDADGAAYVSAIRVLGKGHGRAGSAAGRSHCLTGELGDPTGFVENELALGLHHATGLTLPPPAIRRDALRLEDVQYRDYQQHQ